MAEEEDWDDDVEEEAGLSRREQAKMRPEEDKGVRNNKRKAEEYGVLMAAECLEKMDFDEACEMFRQRFGREVVVEGSVIWVFENGTVNEMVEKSVIMAGNDITVQSCESAICKIRRLYKDGLLLRAIKWKNIWQIDLKKRIEQ
jgi:hypothetical protein